MVSTLTHFVFGVWSIVIFAIISNARSLAQKRDFNIPTNLPGSWSYQGCYVDVGQTLTNDGYNDIIGMTDESCVAYCDSLGYFYAGTEYYHECYCGNALAAGSDPADSSDCSTPCAGDPTEPCGGPNRLALFWNGQEEPQINAATTSSSSVVSTSSTSLTSSASTSPTTGSQVVVASSQLRILLGSASTFAVLSYASITNTGPTIITGDIGTAGTSITGFPPGTFFGSEYIAGTVTAPLTSAITAYDQVASLLDAIVLSGDLAGMTLGPGTYSFSSSASLAAGGVLSLVGTSSSSDVWNFQIGSTLITGAGSNIVLENGALACNIFWQVGSSATLGAGSLFEGTILAAVSVTVTTASVIHGGLFGLGGSVTLDTAEVDYQSCPVVLPAISTTASVSSGISTTSSDSQATTSSGSLTSSSDHSTTSSVLPSTSSSVTSTSAASSTSSAPTVAPIGTLGINLAIGDYNFQGCYTEGDGVRALSAAVYFDYPNMTLEECAASCSAYTYFGVEYHGECYCGNAIDATSVLALNQDDCNFICPGDQFEYCGAGDRLQMYMKGATSASVTSLSSTSISSSGLSSTISSSQITSASASSFSIASSTSSSSSVATSVTSSVPSSSSDLVDTASISTSSTSNACTPSPKVGNLVPDAGFEDDASTAWHFVDASISYTVSNSGLASAELAGNDGAYSLVYDFIPYTSVWGQIIYLSYAAKFTGASNAMCYFQALTGSSTIQEMDNLVTFDWTYFSATYSVPEGDESEGFAFAFICSDTSATLYIDDIYFGPFASDTCTSSSTASLFSSAASSTTSTTSSAGTSSASTSSLPLEAASSSTSTILSAAASSTTSNVSSSTSPSSSTALSTSTISATSSELSTPTRLQTSTDLPVSTDSTTSSSLASSTLLTASTSPSTTTASTSSGSASTTLAIFSGIPTPSIVPSALEDQCVFIGCYTEATNSRALNKDAIYDYTGMTVEMCATYCSKNYLLFGVEYSGECYCGNSLQSGSVLRPPTECNMVCDGASLEFCGGGDRLNVYACVLTTSSTGATASATATAIVIPTPSIVQTAGDYQYAGCYTEATNGRALTGLHYINYQTMTVEICASFCGASFSMFGVEWSGECYCGNVLEPGSVQVADSQCDKLCDGNALAFCGAGNRLNLYSAIPGLTPTTTSTTMATTTTAVNQTPTSTLTSSLPSIASYSYYGCQTEGTNSRALSAKATAYDTMTLESCATDCAGYTYFGTEYGRECYCGNSFSTGSIIAPPSDCSSHCAGDASEICGAGLRLSVYISSNPVTPITPVTPLAPEAAPSNLPTIGAYNYYGCQTEGTTMRALASFSTAYDTMTLESCAKDCEGYSYFGTEYSRECYCGNSFSAGSVSASVVECENEDFLCAGDALEFCGGSRLLSVYELA